MTADKTQRCRTCGQLTNSSSMVSGFVNMLFQKKLIKPSVKLRDALNDAAEWKAQHENLLAMYAASQSQVAELKRDAERYRWLRDLPWGITQHDGHNGEEMWAVGVWCEPSETVDAAIDAARAK